MAMCIRAWCVYAHLCLCTSSFDVTLNFQESGRHSAELPPVFPCFLEVEIVSPPVHWLARDGRIFRAYIFNSMQLYWSFFFMRNKHSWTHSVPEIWSTDASALGIPGSNQLTLESTAWQVVAVARGRLLPLVSCLSLFIHPKSSCSWVTKKIHIAVWITVLWLSFRSC